MNDRKGVKGIDVSDVQPLLDKAKKIVDAKAALDAERGKAVSDAGRVRKLADELQEAIDDGFNGNDGTHAQRAAHLKDLIQEWEGELKEAGADLDIDSIPDKDKLIDAAREVFRGLNIIANDDNYE